MLWVRFLTGLDRPEKICMINWKGQGSELLGMPISQPRLVSSGSIYMTGGMQLDMEISFCFCFILYIFLHFLSLILLSECTIVEQKTVPDPVTILKNYEISHQDSWSKLDQEAQDDLSWSTCEVMLTVQKYCKPYWTRAGNAIL